MSSFVNDTLGEHRVKQPIASDMTWQHAAAAIANKLIHPS